MLNFYQNNITTTDKNRIIDEALSYLKLVPQMNTILSNLPDGICYKFVDGLPGIACYDTYANTIIINACVIQGNYMTSQQRFVFLAALAHELCHANQKNRGLTFDDLTVSSFGDTFRVAKMTEIDALLLEVIVECELLERVEFIDCIPSWHYMFYQYCLKQSKNDIQQANKRFVLSYWKNAMFNMRNGTFAQMFQENISRHYNYYTNQAYHQSVVIHKYEYESTNRTKPLAAIDTYLKRMNLSGMTAELFLQNNFDNAETTVDVDDGVTVFDNKGNKYCNYAPTSRQNLDKITYFENNMPYKIILQNNQTDEQEDVTFIVENMKKLESAIKQRDMNIIRQIFNEDPRILNRQTESSGDFPLLMAIQNNNPEAVVFILNKQPNLLLKTKDGRTIVSELDKLQDATIQAIIKYLYIEQVKERRSVMADQIIAKIK